MTNNEVFIVLANLMDSDGELNEESKERVNKLIEVINFNKKNIILFCGWAYRDDSKITIASAQKKYFEQNSEHSQETYLIENSRDTVGDAVYTRKFIDKLDVEKVHIITSDYHISRTKKIFSFIYGRKYKIILHSANSDIKFDKSESEKKSLDAFIKTFQNADEGDIEQIFSIMIKSHPFYNGDIFKS
tara:strand:+ start:4080 stop:4643 length:564 start_codon:yes stop_codon:yes gene_type:complete